MRPLEHFALAALPMTAYSLARYHRLPAGSTILLLLVATQLPDVIDKPLAWSFGIIPSGRMLAHSLVITAPAFIFIYMLGQRTNRADLAAVFSLGYLSHLLGDFYLILFLGREYYFFPNLFWPILPANPDMMPSFAAHAPGSITQVVLTVVGFGVVCGYVILDLSRGSDRVPNMGR
jgi:membrane-bound metal-dependent hydrolase YbcI (DUF457 family)